MGLNIIITLLMVLGACDKCKCTHVRVSEGESAHLQFAYPCNATRVTLQYAYRLPFYSSANPEFISLPANHELINQNETGSQQCSINLSINPVSRDNEGTYILIVYKNGRMLPEYKRIGLQVNYLPGRASCTSSNDYNDEEWVSLKCRAPVGSETSQIVCYQNGIRLPPLTKPVETRDTFHQIILAQLTGLVYGCSSIMGQDKEMCQCKDVCWDPIHKITLTNCSDPCPAAPSTQGPIALSTHALLTEPVEPTIYPTLQTEMTREITNREMGNSMIRRTRVQNLELKFS